jgi:GNAT superfamily N-acetyltransferase
MAKYHVEPMTRDEVKIAVDWARKEGWNPGLNDAECFYQADPHGFFAGKLNGKIIAIGSAVIYDQHFAFCGCYVVDKDYRNQGYGIKLTQERLGYIGNRNAGLDGVLDMADNYARIGYKFAHNNIRYALKDKPIKALFDPCVLDLPNIPLEQLIQYDRRHFPAPRPQFLRAWINQNTALALGYVQDKQLKGYGVIRKCFDGYKIGPLFADSTSIAETLFTQLAASAQGKTVYLDIPENNPLASELIHKYILLKVSTVARMYLQSPPKLPIENIYGITTLELG